MKQSEFIEQLAKINIILTEEQQEKLSRFYELLIIWNEKINLTRITTKEDVYLKHFYDSLTLIKAIDLSKKITLCDVGSGAGFPGIVLKIVFPNLEITLIDALNKRVNYLNEIISELQLENIVAIHTRSEDYARNNYEKYDIVVARAVANLRILSELCIPLVKVNGYFIAMKGIISSEIKDADDILKKLDSEIINISSFTLPYENSQRNLIKIRKNAKTNHKYPRKFDKIKKQNNNCKE